MTSIESEWSCDDPDVRVSSSWRVFEISSGDEGDTGNYGTSQLYPRSHIDGRLPPSTICLWTSRQRRDFHPVPVLLFLRLPAVQVRRFRQGSHDLCLSRMYVPNLIIYHELMIRASERCRPNPQPKTIRPLHPSLVHFRPILLSPKFCLSTSITHPDLSGNNRSIRPTSLCGFRQISREGM
jgi:hypothetical protein